MDTKVRTYSHDGFTLIELVIVVAIIGILSMIAVPIFSEQLELAREATDVSNIRSAYMDLMSDTNIQENAEVKKIALTQEVDHRQSTVNLPTTVIGEPAVDGYANVYYNHDENGAVIEFTSATGNISYHHQGLYGDTFYISDANVTSGTFGDIDKSQVIKVVFESGSTFKDGDSSGFFSGMTNLEEIDMLNVKLLKTNYNTFSNTPKLRKITLADLDDWVGYDFPGTWYYDEECTEQVAVGKRIGYSRITMKDNGKTLYRKTE